MSLSCTLSRSGSRGPGVPIIRPVRWCSHEEAKEVRLCGNEMGDPTKAAPAVRGNDGGGSPPGAAGEGHEGPHTRAISEGCQPNIDARTQPTWLNAGRSADCADSADSSRLSPNLRNSTVVPLASRRPAPCQFTPACRRGMQGRAGTERDRGVIVFPTLCQTEAAEPATGAPAKAGPSFPSFNRAVSH